jgi:hypothetical protein
MKDKLVKRFVIGTFVSLYALVSIISTIHVIDFFELSNPYWLAVTLAIGFEIGAAASLASLVILKKMNKTIVWSLFIAITLMQMQGNMYYAFINLEDFTAWSELFNLIEEDLIDQKRILAFVSGAILPLIALGFIKSLVDYIKPEDEDDVISEGILGDSDSDEEDEWASTINDDLEDETSWADLNYNEEEYDAYVDRHEPGSWLKNEPDVDIEEELEPEEEWDEDHALDMVMNDMVKDMDVQDFEEVNHQEELDKASEAGSEESVEMPNPTSVGFMVQKLDTPHLPQDEDSLYKEALRKKAIEDKKSFIKKNQNDNENSN